MKFGQTAFSKEQKKLLEEKEAAFSQARERYNRALWALNEVLAEFGRRKREICERLMTLPTGAKDQRCQQILDKSLYHLQEGRGVERSGLTGAAMRQWGRRDLSLPEVEGLAPQDAFSVFENRTALLLKDAEKLEAMEAPVRRWDSCAGELMIELERRLDKPAKAKSVASLLSLFLDAEIFQREGADITLRKQEIETAVTAIEAAVAQMAKLRKKK